MGFLLRWVCALVLVTATYNPTDLNYVRWVRQTYPDQLPLMVLLGLLLAIGYIIYLRATLRSIGALGMVLILAVVAALIWVLIDYGLLDLTNRALTPWIGIVALSLVLGIGLSWSIIRRKLSGQADVDDVDE